MNKNIVLNAGSSSLKMSVFAGNDEVVSASVARIWEEGTFLSFEYDNQKEKELINVENHAQALEILKQLLLEKKVISELSDIAWVAHRVVHGGEFFSDSVVINTAVIEKIRECITLAPLHNRVNLSCIMAAQDVFPEALHVAVFDTAFHQTIPEINYLYAIPRRFYEKYKIRKYWFHGISHQYVSQRILKISKRNPKKIISCHIGNGASICAIRGGKSINNSMWFTPVDGLVMGTRAGDIDPGVVLFLQEKEHLSSEEMSELINKHSGMLGLTGKVSDLKDIEDGIASNHPEYKLALDIYVSRIVRFIGAYIADIGWVDAIIFTAGVLENSVNIRELIAEKLNFCGVDFDYTQNDFRWEERLISTENSETELYVIPTREEYMMMKEMEKITKN